MLGSRVVKLRVSGNECGWCPKGSNGTDFGKRISFVIWSVDGLSLGIVTLQKDSRYKQGKDRKMKIVIYDRVGIGRVVFTRRGDEKMTQFTIGDRCSIVFMGRARIVGCLFFFDAFGSTETDASVVVMVRQYGEQQKCKPCK